MLNVLNALCGTASFLNAVLVEPAAEKSNREGRRDNLLMETNVVLTHVIKKARSFISCLYAMNDEMFVFERPRAL